VTSGPDDRDHVTAALEIVEARFTTNGKSRSGIAAQPYGRTLPSRFCAASHQGGQSGRKMSDVSPTTRAASHHERCRANGNVNRRTEGVSTRRIAAAGHRVASMSAATTHIVVLPVDIPALNWTGTSEAARSGHDHHAGFQ
jgi:hypothetical protein